MQQSWLVTQFLYLRHTSKGQGFENLKRYGTACDNFDINFKNLIDNARNTCPKSKPAPYFKGTNNEFLRKATDINASPRFYVSN